MANKLKSFCKAITLPGFLMVFIPAITLIMISILVYLGIACHGGLVFDQEVRVRTFSLIINNLYTL